MRPYLLLATFVVFGAVLLAGCNSTNNSTAQTTQKPKTKLGPETTYADGARRVTTAELAELIKNKEAFVVDVRNEEMYNKGHIPGAKLIPSSDILKHVNELPKDKLIVTYCS
jgi:3-mercaptopyruvate sulfurtransferase SseA